MSFNSNNPREFNISAHSSFPQFAELSKIATLSETEIDSLYAEILKEGVHGFCFSLYEEGQKPGDMVTAEQIERRLKILKPHCNWIRTFSCTEGNELIPQIAKELGFKTLVGAWIEGDKSKNKTEIEGLIALAEKGLVDIAAVGNEVLYRNELSVDELCNLIAETKQLIPNIPVGYVDAYYQFVVNRNVADICDVILTNCYPYWEGTAIENAIYHTNDMYHQALSVANGKKVIVSEAGWPSQGDNFKAALPSAQNAKQYFVQFQLWAKSLGIETFYFSSFDESWKTGDEGDVGAYWGIWDSAENLK